MSSEGTLHHHQQSTEWLKLFHVYSLNQLSLFHGLSKIRIAEYWLHVATVRLSYRFPSRHCNCFHLYRTSCISQRTSRFFFLKKTWWANLQNKCWGNHCGYLKKIDGATLQKRMLGEPLQLSSLLVLYHGRSTGYLLVSRRMSISCLQGTSIVEL